MAGASAFSNPDSIFKEPKYVIFYTQLFSKLEPVVQRVDNAIERINHYFISVGKTTRLSTRIMIYPKDSVIIYPLNHRALDYKINTGHDSDLLVAYLWLQEYYLFFFFKKTTPNLILRLKQLKNPSLWAVYTLIDRKMMP